MINLFPGCTNARSPATAAAATLPDEHDERPMAVIQLDFLDVVNMQNPQVKLWTQIFSAE